jgi:antirestriction protein ArdC
MSTEHRTERRSVDVYQAITDQIVQVIERGAGPFELPWYREHGRIERPVNALSGKPYQGANVVSLWAAAMVASYPSAYWASYRQWQSLSAQVRKGEKGSLIVFYKTVEVQTEAADEIEAEGRKRIPLARASFVFNAAQVDDWEPPSPPAIDQVQVIGDAEAFVSATGATIRHGGDSAYYHPKDDYIQVPERGRFLGSLTSTPTDAYYATLLHELTHWSGHVSRLNRILAGRFGDAAYAMEELVAELGAAFLCADLAVTNIPRPDHAAYIGRWLAVLKGDKKALFSAAAAASRAAGYLADLRGERTTKGAPSIPPRECLAEASRLSPAEAGGPPMDERTARIRELNDRLRRDGVGGKMMITVGIQHLAKPSPAEVLKAVRDFDAFTPENDPHGEHDCATLVVDGRTILWKIDYYDRELRYHSPDAANRDVTSRVLTVMLAEEY